MPKGDGTGPMGMGPMTGRRAGFCAGYNHPGYIAGGFGGRCFRNYAFGGRSFRNMYYATGLPGWARGAYPYNADAEKDFLENRTKILEQELDAIKKRLDDIKGNDGDGKKE